MAGIGVTHFPIFEKLRKNDASSCLGPSLIPIPRLATETPLSVHLSEDCVESPTDVLRAAAAAAAALHFPVLLNEARRGMDI